MHAHIRWTTPILSYLKDGQLPPDPEEAKKIQKWTARFTVLNDGLYKRGFSQPYLRCVEEEEVKCVLEEVPYLRFVAIIWEQNPLSKRS